MEPGFFLGLADNIGDNFSYIILPVKHWNKLPVHRRPTTLVRSVVRSIRIESSDSLICVKSPDGFKVYNRYGEDLCGTEEIYTSPSPSVPPIGLATNDENNIIPTNHESITFNDDNVMEITQPGIDTPMSLSNQLLIEEEGNLHLTLSI